MPRLAPDDPRLVPIYKDVPAAQREVLVRFRAGHPLKEAVVGGRTWEYIDAGRGSRPLLLLPGALTTADSLWISLPHFEDRFRVIAPTYSTDPTLAGLVDGIVGILDREGIDRLAVSGGSYGGMVAQVLVRRHPDRVERLILSHTLLPDPSKARQVERIYRFFRLLPGSWLRALFRKRTAGLLPDHPETALIRAYIREFADIHATKEVLVALYARMVDYFTAYDFKPGDLEGWPGRLLLLMSDNDPVTPEPVRKAQQAAYPMAEAHVFTGGGHATALLQPELYFGVMDRFLA